MISASPIRHHLLRTLCHSLLALGTIFSGCKKQAPAQKQGPLPVNVVTAIEKEVTEWDEFTGRIEAVESVEIRPRVTGYITEVAFKAGAIVNAGDLLFVIDPRPYQADLDRASANLEQAQAQLKLAQIDFRRAEDLRQKKVTSPEEFDQKAAANQQAEASVRSAQAAKDAAALNLDFTKIKSPITGRVSNERVTVGNLVQSSMGAEGILTTVVSIDPIYVYVDADENSILKYLKLRDEGKRRSARDEQIPAYIELANETGFPHEGYIDFVDNKLDPTTGTQRARGVFKSWNPLLAPGFFVRMRVPGAGKYRAVLIEDKVISSQQGVKYVFVVKADNTIERRNIVTATTFEGLRIVKSGLNDGDKVVSTRLQILQPGMPVVPMPEPKAEPAKPADEPASSPPPAAKSEENK
ncbi:MAG: efflux RND transporter periplasmic adaptor subunit [Chthoniobacteraceae bacterium]